MRPKPGMELDSSAPIYIIELGSGCGKFCFYMLKVRICEIIRFAMYLALPTLTLCCCCNPQALNELELMLPVPFAKVRGAQLESWDATKWGQIHYFSRFAYKYEQYLAACAEKLVFNKFMLLSWNLFAPFFSSFASYVTWLAACHFATRKLFT